MKFIRLDGGMAVAAPPIFACLQKKIATTAFFCVIRYTEPLDVLPLAKPGVRAGDLGMKKRNQMVGFMYGQDQWICLRKDLVYRDYEFRNLFLTSVYPYIALGSIARFISSNVNSLNSTPDNISAHFVAYKNCNYRYYH